jgi:hypothetical protein
MSSRLPYFVSKTIVQQQRRKQRNCSRFFTIVSSIEPAYDGNEPTLASGYYERPGTVLYAESSFYSKTGNSWVEYFKKEFPRRGIHFVNVSMFDAMYLSEGEDWKFENPYTYLKWEEEQLAKDISTFPAPVLITRGGLLSLVAQFYLESYALSGLVMLDPYVLPEVASSSAPYCSTSSSCSKLIQSMEVEERNSQQPILLQETDRELNLLKLLSIPGSSSKDIRLLKLEPSSVPMLLIYPTTYVNLTGCQEWTKYCVQTIADYHSDIEEGMVDVQCLQQQHQHHKALESINSIVTWLDDKIG